jgi:D-tyrosyl-tRNA(Tyr) deacylase
MRVVIQRVSSASVSIRGIIHSEINCGLLILLGVETGDSEEDGEWLASKCFQMRIFSDAEDKMNLSIGDTGGEVLVVSQFTLHASTKKGNRPGFSRSARPEQAIPLYEHFCNALRIQGLKVKEGVFGADMQVSLVNDGPVTILMDSKNKD